MASRGNFKDPTAETALGNLKDYKPGRRAESSPRWLVRRHPAEFAGLSALEARNVGLRAWELAGRGDPHDITAEHIIAARRTARGVSEQARGAL